MKWRTLIISTVVLFGAGAAPVIDVPEHYYVRNGPADEAQFSEAERTHDTSKLTETHVIGTACYNEFRAEGEKTIRERVECSEYFKGRDVFGHRPPSMEGRKWIGYSTYLFDTPSGDLEEGYYAKSKRTVQISAAQAALEALTPTADAAVAYDSQSNSGVGLANTVSFSHTAPASGSLVVMASANDTSGGGDIKASFCTYNSVNLFYNTNIASGSFSVYAYELHNPTAGANTVYCEWNDNSAAGSPTDSFAIAVSLTGADQSIPIDVYGTSSGSSAVASITLTTTVDGTIVIDSATTDESESSDIIPGGSLHTQIAEIEPTSENWIVGWAGPVSPAGATTTSWSWTGTEAWVIAAVAVQPPCAAFTRCTDVITTTGTTTWTAPTGVTSVDAACWGAGGGGESGGATGNGGGGGGAYASTTGIAVTAGVGYSVFLGSGGAAETAGTPSYFYNGTNYSPFACAGLGATTATGAAGGTTACSVGSAAEFAGGAGGNGSDSGDTGGGGGGAGGPTGDGVTAGNGTIAVGGDGGSGNAAGVYGGPGATGASSNNASQGPSGKQGGGGGGGGDNATTGGAGGIAAGGGGGEGGGGVGGQGMCRISYTPAAGGGSPPPAPTMPLFIWFE